VPRGESDQVHDVRDDLEVPLVQLGAPACRVVRLKYVPGRGVSDGYVPAACVLGIQNNAASEQCNPTSTPG
jgi:hypothetical protein